MDPVTENYQLKWHSFSSHLYGCVANYFNNESFSDVVLFTMDGHQISAHRFVLSTCSQYFHQILKIQQKLTSTLPTIIVLPPEIHYRTMKILTQYMYTGEATVSKDILENVLRGGDLLKIQGLWRPRDEGHQDKKLVKVHQKTNLIANSRQQSHTDQGLNRQATTSHSSQSDAKENHRKEKSKEQNSKTEGKQKETEKEKHSEKASDSNQEITKRKDSLNSSNTNEHNDEENGSQNNLQFLVIKEEPLEWNEVNECEMELIEDDDVFHTEMTIKPEIVLDDRYDDVSPPEQIYSPLTCELCSESFPLPADWVKHIQSHTDMMPAKRRRQRRSSNDEDELGSFPPLRCDMCEKFFPTPAEWVHHIQNTHTEFELRISNKTVPTRPLRVNRQIGTAHKVCTQCNKKFPSHASMLIHKRTHTGEKPYMCEFCNKGFNVKSNLLRHLRTLHDMIINSTEIESKEVQPIPSTSEEVKD